MIIAASLNIATLFPWLAMRPKRPALPFKDVEKDEKTLVFVATFQRQYTDAARMRGLRVRTVLSMTSWLRALSYMSIVTPRRAVTFEDSSDRRALFCLERTEAAVSKTMT
jgi:hypothetical protein